MTESKKHFQDLQKYLLFELRSIPRSKMSSESFASRKLDILTALGNVLGLPKKLWIFNQSD